MSFKILDKFTTHLKDALANSFEIAAGLSLPLVSPLLLLYTLSLQKGSVAAEILSKTKVEKNKLRGSLAAMSAALAENIFSFGKEAPLPALTREAQRALERAVSLAWQNDHNYVGTEHLLLSLVQIKEADLSQALAAQNIDERAIEQFAKNVLDNTVKFPEIDALLNDLSPEEEIGTKTKDRQTLTKTKQRRKTPALDFFAADLTAPKGASPKMDPLIGRQKEITRLMQILSRRYKNNPVLLGDPGVGKTAIVEGLAQKIAAGDVPLELQDKRILTLDLGLVLAGTIYRGEFEGRLKQILDEIRSDQRIIVFIDEIHTLVGTGGGGGTLDAANILKPALARGEIRCIGATTVEEYKKHIESDAALERRFQPLFVTEPSKSETVAILKGLRSNYEKYHSVKITDEAVTAAVNLGERYAPEKFFPDKAIDLIDEAAAGKKLGSKQSLLTRKIKQLEKKLRELKEAKQQAIIAEKFDLALKLKNDETAFSQELQKLENSSAYRPSSRYTASVTATDIANVVAASCGVPVNQLKEEEKDRLLNLEREIGQYIFGQEEAVAGVVSALRRANLGLNSADRPLASFILAGPSGVGKTELAKVLAKLIFGDTKALVRLDMSEFSESFQASKLIGSPAGYVGYKDGNKFTDVIKRRPYSIVLFDEIDKAHPEIFNLFLQILDEGHLTDATGKKVNFKNTIVLMTTNVGMEHFSPAGIGFEPFGSAQGRLRREACRQITAADLAGAKASVLKDLQNKFRREFLNRVDAVLVFNPLTEETLEKIVERQVEELNARLAARGTVLQLSEEARRVLVRKSLEKDQGARSIAKLLQEEVAEPLARRLLKEDREEAKILVGSDGQNIYLE